MTEAKHCYTDEKNAQIVIALLKAHGIRKVIANPGTTNIPIVGSVQNDPWFEVYSGIDERHSAYMAVGMAAESGEPVVLSCTGATASRNYFPALTEAYYRKIPVLAITSSHHFNDCGSLLPQAIDRSVQPKDTVRYSVQCSVPHTPQEEADCVSNINKALLELTRHGGGPVHINLETARQFTFNTKSLPDVRVIRRWTLDSASKAPRIDDAKKVAIWVGSHRPFSESEVEAIERFVKSHNAIVVTEKTSEYRGLGAVNVSLIGQQSAIWSNPKYDQIRPDLIVQIGEIPADPGIFGFIGGCCEYWRVSEDGEVRDLFNRLTNVFEMTETQFFDMMSEDGPQSAGYANAVSVLDAELRENIPELPFSNLWIASKTCAHLPAGSVLHLGIYNSLRSWNMFQLPYGVTANSNVGGFGIDGALSTIIGASLASPSKLFFGVFGDLAFFYDLNSLGNRHIGNNVRILLVNNGCGSEFRIYSHPASKFGERANDYMAAGGHFKKHPYDVVKHFAEDNGFKYLSASNKDEFENTVEQFLSVEQDAPIIFECFTKPEDESDALKLINSIDKYEPPAQPLTVKGAIKAVVPQRIKNIIKAAIGR